MNTRRKRRWLRRGFTLIELILVLAVLAVVLSLALPELRRLSRKSEIRDAAKQLRLALLQTRLAAIESGSVMSFRYQPESGAFEILAAGAAPAAPRTESVEAGAATSGGVTSPSAALGPGPLPSARTLPAGVWFAGASRGAAIAARESSEPETGSAAAGWSAPIVFFPNGRTGNAQFHLRNDRYWLGVTLRGLTGRVQIGAVQRWEAATEEPLPDWSSESLP